MTFNVSIDFEGDSLHELKMLSELFIEELKNVDRKSVNKCHEDFIYTCINNAIKKMQ